MANNDYEYNFSNKLKKLKDVNELCLERAKDNVELRDTDSYFKEVLDIIGSDFAKAIQSELVNID